MKKTISKLFKILLIVLLCFSTINITIQNVKAAEPSFKFTGPTEASKGDVLTFTVQGTGLTGKVLLSGTGVTLSSDQVWVERNSVTFTATVNSFPASVVATPQELTNDNYEIETGISASSITISEKVTTQTDPQPPTQTEPGPETNPQQPGTTGETPQPGENTNTVPQDNPTPQEPEKSRNCYLSSLKVNDGQRELDVKQTRDTSAGFNREVEDYTVVFPENYKFEELNSIKLVATAEDSKAKISGTGDKTVNEGDNTFEVSCTAENGTVKTYRVKLTKAVTINKSELKLDALVIEKVKENGEKENIKFDKDFDKEVQEYTCDVESDIVTLNIKLLTSKVKDKDIIVRINGKEIKRDVDGKLETEEYKLEDGKNTIRIVLVSPTDESVTTDYVVTVNREAKVVEKVEEKKGFSIKTEDIPKLVIGVILGIILLLVIVLVILIIINNKQKKKSGIVIKESNDSNDSKKEEKFDESYLSDKNLERLNKEYTSYAENKNENESGDEEEQKEVSDEVVKEPEPEAIKTDYGTADELEMLEKNIKALEEENKLNGNKPEGEKDYEEELDNKEKNYENESEESRKQRLEELVEEIKSKQKGKNPGKHSN